MGPNKYMYHHSSSNGVVAMNAANKETIRARTGIDLLNACLVLFLVGKFGGNSLEFRGIANCGPFMTGIFVGIQFFD